MKQQTASPKIVNAWAMYDWANSAYNLVITSTIFPTYFEAVTGDNNEATTADTVTFLGRSFVNTSLYNYALAIAFLIVAISSPLLSSTADYRGNKKSFLFAFCTLGSASCAALYFFTGTENLGFGLLAMMLACLGYWGSLVFYNSFLPEIAAPEDRDRISAKGFARGYIGSMILQIICFVFVLKPELFGINAGMGSRICFVLVGLWWWGFAQWSLRRLPKGVAIIQIEGAKKGLSSGYAQLTKVWAQIAQMPVLKRYLGAFFFYNMGVQTVMLVATLYGKVELGIPTTNLIVAILIIQLIAVPGAFGISWLSGRIGNLQALMVVVGLWIALCYIGYRLPRNGIFEFYGLAAGVGFVMGGIQSLSRSTYAKLMPPTLNNTGFFSFYDVAEKLSIVAGMLSFGYILELTGSQRNSVLALMVFFVIGLVVLWVALKTERSGSFEKQEADSVQ